MEKSWKELQKEWIKNHKIKVGRTIHGSTKKPKSKTAKVKVGSSVWERV